MRAPSTYPQAAFFGMLLSTLVMGQTAFPDHVIQDETWTDGVHHVAVTQKILSPGDEYQPMVISGTADAEYVSGTSIHLAPGFHAGDLTGNAKFHAHIDQAMGADGDVVLVAPDPYASVMSNTLHVPKWEKLEIGLRLPQEYQDAIERFFVNYYADSSNSFVATPGNVDTVHDLNPYADDSLQLVMTLTSPSGAHTMKWGFFMREAMWEGNSPASLPVEDTSDGLYPYHIRFRLAPEEEGDWQFSLSLNTPHTTTVGGSPLPSALYTGYTFHCDPALPDNIGPLEVNANNRRTLQFADGTPYFGLGVNLEATGYGQDVPGCGSGFNNSWADGNGYRLVWSNFLNVSKAMEDLRSAGGNFARVWLMNKTFAPENVNLGVYDRFRELLQCGSEDSIACSPIVRGNAQYNSWVFDQLLDSARQKGIYFQLCIVPYAPLVAYESWGWRHDPYLLHFVAPRDSASGLYDMKRYFYSNGDPATANDPGSAFYYWKRKYKYILSRWGYSVNIPIIEPFNEIDQMLTYHDVNMAPPHKNYNCPENSLHWVADPGLPATYSSWLSDIIHYVKDPVDLEHPATSPLGEGAKLFLVGTGPERDANNNDLPPNNPDNPNWNLPNKNPDVDLVDVHHGLYSGEGELSNSFSSSQDIRDAYTSSANGSKRPFHQGESNYYQGVDIATYTGADTVANVKEAADYFDNYDVSFHNEIWASTFFGNFAAASSWQKERIFWLPNTLPQMFGTNHIPYDLSNQTQIYHSGVLNAYNILQVGSQSTDTVKVQNRTIYHNFKPLSDMLSNADWQSYEFFSGDFSPHKICNDTNKIECYYLVNADSTLAIGWVHNLNAYWEKHYYVTSAVQNFFGCTSPSAQQVSLPDLAVGPDYHITWFPTRMNDTIHPVNAVDTTGTGTVLLDMGTAPLGDTAYKYLDTLHLDYGFIISLAPVHRNMIVPAEADLPPSTGWDFGLYPNPAQNRLNVVLPDEAARDITIYDLSGRQVYHKSQAEGPLIIIQTERFSRGTYCIRVSDVVVVRNKLLIIQ